MKLPSAYLKMRILGAIDYAHGKSISERIRTIARQTFTDEDGNQRQFTWRTIQTWLYRYKSQGVTGVQPKTRNDKGRSRKVSPEELLEALNIARRHFHDKYPDKMCLYRHCIEKGLLNKSDISPTTFYRFIREHDLLKDDDTAGKKRLAFCMQYANQLWQADTLFGPYVRRAGKPAQTKLIAFIDDASRIITHAQFFFEENTWALIAALKNALYKRGIPEQLYKVKKDNTFSFKNIRYETPVDLRDKTITIRFDRSRFDRIVIYYKDQRLGEAKPLDPIANGLLRRKEHLS